MDAGELLAALQLGDSAFPSGSFVASWGLEALVATGAVAGAPDLRAMVEGQLRYRWATCDRAALVRAYRAAPDLVELVAIDAEVDAVTVAPVARAASTRIGGSLLAVDAAVGGQASASLLELVRAGATHGHQPVVQGLLGWSRGLTEATTVIVSGFQLASGLIGAGVRLGVIGHLDAQRTLDGLRPVIAELALDDLAVHLTSSAIGADLAMLRHEALPNRLFAC